MADTSLISKDLAFILEQEAQGENLENLEGVDVMCSYVMDTGVRVLESFFQSLRFRDPPVPVRILITSQHGISEPEAIHLLASLNNVQVKMFITNTQTFHPKAWLFSRTDESKANKDIAIVGSSNMSRSAMENGIEISIHTAAIATTTELSKVFERYWSAPCEDWISCQHISENEKQADWISYQGKSEDEWRWLLGFFPPGEAEPGCIDPNCRHQRCEKLRDKLKDLDNQRTRIEQQLRGQIARD
jgi:HKD family nuclease